MGDKDNKSKQRFSKWYGENKDEHNESRRDNYNPTEADLAKARKNARNQVPKEEQLEIYVDGELIKAYRIGHIAYKLGRPLHTVKYWEGRGYLPEPTIESRHRMYTENQVELIIHLGSYMPHRKKRGAELDPTIMEQVKYVADNWNPKGD